MPKRKTLLLWLIALLLTIVLAVYQRLSGPTHPVRRTENIAGVEFSYKFYRSWNSGQTLPVRIKTNNDMVHARIYYRRYPPLDNENWSRTAMEKKAGLLTASIPGQPPAGKVIYKVEAMAGGKNVWLNSGRAVVARFKGKVPTVLIIVHIIFMFSGLLLAFRTGLEALHRDGHWQKLVAWTLGITFCGGLILGPLIQKFAFGALWTGFPLGGDLTDSKTLFAVLVWLAAFFLRHKSKWWPLAATVLMITIYLIPHSLLGSELNYRTGKIETATTSESTRPK
ncbi:MAG: hypothetical protein JXI33_08875 [Candidatus Aminicenantes bacterium]|nr:hypothetical protein [Candidatus Aminicenantes bacterium]